MSDELTARLDELETRLAFQDDTIEALNEAVSRQQLELEKLQRSLELLAQRQADLAASLPGGVEDDQPPPHY
ncbi:SlyX family protein [Halopseudomonas pertucinogena]|uniref:Protein SlyX homolog n=1 Tax=Halopseudomonas pertucinogena TaxID=86175 RepID=A0ABQ2CJ59_9GAMM|nr:SlyX family protein [Halopseudomonas pertucinogena]GGI91794.1 protein SlyX [Halopseudomonas pertucinogena]